MLLSLASVRLVSAWMQPAQLRRAIALAVMFGASASAQSQTLSSSPQNGVQSATVPTPAEQFHRSRTNPGGAESSPQLICFPPNPTVLVGEFELPPLPPTPVQLAPLAPHIGEYFYAPLSSYLLHDQMNRGWKKRLDQHAALKRALLEEIHAQMREAEGRSFAERAAAWRALAGAQASRLEQLDRMAEKLRTDLTRGKLFGPAASNWYTKREWRLGRGALNGPREEMVIFEYQVVRAAAYYQPKISTAWRRLMHETAIELEAAVFAPAEAAQLEADPFAFFSPDLARVLPPEEARPAFARYAEAKSALKRELRDAIYAADGAIFGSERDRQILEFTIQNEARRLALEQQAEEIRQSLAGAETDAVPPEAMLLAPAIEARLVVFEQEKQKVEHELLQRLYASGRGLPPKPAGDPSSAEYRDWAEVRMEARRKAEGEFLHERRAELRRLAAEAEALREEIESVFGPLPDLGRGRSFDSFITDFLVQRRQRTSHRDYHVACFEPGLSLAQRWLLFDAAMVALHLPLPGPQLQPRGMPGTVLPLANHTPR